MLSTFAQLVGSAFRPGEDRKHLIALPLGAEFTLEHDPYNPYDSNAVRVLSGDHFVGHIERGTAADLAPLLDSGATFRTVIKRKDDPKKPLLEITQLTEAGLPVVRTQA